MVKKEVRNFLFQLFLKLNQIVKRKLETEKKKETQEELKKQSKN